MADFNDFLKNIKNITTNKKNANNVNLYPNFSIFTPLENEDSLLDILGNKQNKTDTINNLHKNTINTSNQEQVNETTLNKGFTIKETPQIKEMDFYNINKIKEEEQLVLLKKQIVQLQTEINNLNKMVEDYKNRFNELEASQHKYMFLANKYRELLINLIKYTPLFISQKEFVIDKINLLKDKELVDYFILCFKDLVQKYNSLIDDYNVLQEKFQNYIKEQELEKDMIKKTYSNIVDKNFVDSGNNKDNLYMKDEIIISPSDLLPNMDEDSELNDIIKSLDNITEKALVVIGDNGISDYDDIKNNPDLAWITINIINDLVKLNLIKEYSLNWGLPISIKKRIFNLTNLGKDVYKKITNNVAIETEFERLLREHTTIEHGYFIKLVKEEFKKQNFNVYDKFEDLKINIYNLNDKTQKRVEADLIIENEDVLYIVECEMNTTTEDMMVRKLGKLVYSIQELSLESDKLVNILIVVPNKDALNGILNKLEYSKNYLNLNQFNKILVNITTYNDLIKNKPYQQFFLN